MVSEISAEKKTQKNIKIHIKSFSAKKTEKNMLLSTSQWWCVSTHKTKNKTVKTAHLDSMNNEAFRRMPLSETNIQKWRSISIGTKKMQHETAHTHASVHLLWNMAQSKFNTDNRVKHVFMLKSFCFFCSRKCKENTMKKKQKNYPYRFFAGNSAVPKHQIECTVWIFCRLSDETL